MQKLKTIPFFLVLLALFFCLHGSAENFGSLTVKEVILTGLSVLGFTLVMFGVVYLFTRKYLLAALITFFIALWYFFFGAIHDFLKSFSLLSFLKSYSVLLPALLIVTILWIIFLKRKAGLWQKLTLYLNILLLIYCVLDLSKIGYMAASAKQTTSVDIFNYAAVKQKPDVYFLLFDEYPGQKSLKDSFNFDNERLIAFMQQNQFVALPITSNYDLTVFSMSSMLNMEYIKTKWHLPSVNQKDVQIRSSEIKEAAVFYYFSGMGYTINNNSIFDIQDKPGISDENSFLLGHSILLTDKILLHRINKDLSASFPPWVSNIIPFINSQDYYKHREDNAKVEKNIISFLKKDSINKPIFSYSHFLLPHPPFYYDSLGRESSFEKMTSPVSWTINNDFIAYLKYTNSVIQKVVNSLRKAKPHAIVIVMSDHGFREYVNDDGLYQPARFNNMCWVYFPNGNYGNAEQPLSNVNFFRYLFNNQFGQQMNYLKDSSINVRFTP
jgi:hypothetical protein